MIDPDPSAVGGSTASQVDLPKRRSKEISLDEAGRRIAACKVLSLGNEPMALVRAAIRAGAKDLTLIPAVVTSMSSDLLIAAGCVETFYVCYIGFETLGLAPAFRKATEGPGEKALKVVEGDEVLIVLGTRAGAGGLPFVPIKDVYEGTDLPRLNPLIKTVIDPYTGEEIKTIPALRSDMCIIHAQEADIYGNAICKGSNNQEADKALASDYVIVQADRIVSTDRIRSNPHATTLPGNLVHAVVHAPFGAHPLGSGYTYQMDVPHVRRYLDSVRNGTFDSYLNDFVTGVADEWDYLEKVGVKSLLTLQRNV